IGKRADSIYVSRRTRDWLKFKCSKSQEFVIGGFTDPKGSRIGFGALLVGYYEKGHLRYAGKVGTGYDFALLKKLGERLKKIEKKSSSFSQPIREKNSHFVRPILVCEIAFTEWTRDGKLRHPRFTGIRTDKAAKTVIREK
ncbi:MAG: ATP-dependent DNA ligase, partial [Chlamydiae bacterium]|nr:ATP-dependent DNA ligase [Chlamydiota bacterium]